MHHVVPALLAAGCLLAMWLTARRGDRFAFAASVMMAGVWVVANLLWLHNALNLLPLVDLTFGSVVLLMWVERPSAWAAQVVTLTFLRHAAHAVNELTHYAFTVPYIHALNALFAAQLFVIATPGGIHGVTRLFHIFRPRNRGCEGHAARRTPES